MTPEWPKAKTSHFPSVNADSKALPIRLCHTRIGFPAMDNRTLTMRLSACGLKHMTTTTTTSGYWSRTVPSWHSQRSTNRVPSNAVVSKAEIEFWTAFESRLRPACRATRENNARVDRTDNDKAVSIWSVEWSSAVCVTQRWAFCR